MGDWETDYFAYCFLHRRLVNFRHAARRHALQKQQQHTQLWQLDFRGKALRTALRSGQLPPSDLVVTSSHPIGLRSLYLSAPKLRAPLHVMII